MRRLLLFSLILTVGVGLAPAQAQTTHVVVLNGMTFTPNDLTINAGDTVVWQNKGGIHNVNGTQASYPSNPVGFSSGAAQGAPWTFSFTFETPGDYDYHCDVHGSPGTGMIGTIAVNSTASVADEVPQGVQLEPAYPNPFRTETRFTLTLDETQTVRVAVYDAAGREIAVLLDEAVPAGTPRRIDWQPGDAPAGVYLYRIEGRAFQLTRKVIRVR